MDRLIVTNFLCLRLRSLGNDRSVHIFSENNNDALWAIEYELCPCILFRLSDFGDRFAWFK